MDQQNLSTLAGVVNATEDFLKSQIVAKDQHIAQLEQSLARARDMSSTNYKAAQTLIDSMREWTLNALDEREISETNAEEIAELCGFELEKEFEVEVTVTYNLTVNARTAEDAESAVHDIDFDTVSYNDDSISYLSSSVDRVDI